MNALKRLTVTIGAQFNDFIDQVENHEAVAEAALKQFRANIYQAKFQAKCLETEMKQGSQKRKDLETEIRRWKERAVTLEATDREKAVECVSRMKAAQLEHDAVCQQIKEMDLVHAEVLRDLSQIDTQYSALQRKQRILASRESRANAMKDLKSASRGPESGVGDIFSRWESRISRAEIEGEMIVSPSDSLKNEFDRADERMDLESSLDELIKTSKNQ